MSNESDSMRVKQLEKENKRLQEKLEQLMLEKAARENENKITSNPSNLAAARAVKPFERSASSVDEKEEAQEKYHKEILLQGEQSGAFVHVPTHLAFVMGVYDDGLLEVLGNDNNDFSMTDFFNPDTETWCGSQKNSYEGEFEDTITATISQCIHGALHKLVSESGMENQEFLFHVIHELPMHVKQQKSSKDVGVLVRTDKSSKLENLLVLQHKTRTGFNKFFYQTMVYATDSSSIRQKSMIAIQSRGATLEKTSFRAYGIIPTWKEDKNSETSPTRAYSFLYEGKGFKALARIVCGLYSCIPFFLAEKDCIHNGQVLSAVTAMYPDLSSLISAKDSVKNIKSGILIRKENMVYKSFDYRNRKNAGYRRCHNIALYGQFQNTGIILNIPATCTANQNSLQILAMPHDDENDLHRSIHVENLKLVLDSLSIVHGKSYVHGDIRLLNILLQSGKLIDFDLSRQEDSTYPEGLQLLEWDGKRAEEVESAINEKTVGQLKMKKWHDVVSMIRVFDLYKGKKDNDKWKKFIKELLGIKEPDVNGIAREMDTFIQENQKYELELKEPEEGRKLGTGSPQKEKENNKHQKSTSSSVNCSKMPSITENETI